jgi:hypothetical protein
MSQFSTSTTHYAMQMLYLFQDNPHNRQVNISRDQYEANIFTCLSSVNAAIIMGLFSGLLRDA